MLNDVEKVMVKKYGSPNVSKQRRSVTVNFPDGEDEEKGDEGERGFHGVAPGTGREGAGVSA